MAPILAVDGTVFAAVVIGVVVVGVIVAVVLGLAGRDAYDHIGRGGLAANRPDGDDQRDEEIRQLLAARRERRARRARAGTPDAAPGQPAVVDPGVAEEVRQLVAARNARRLRQGLAPLDVDEEVARRMRELSSPGH